MYKRNNETPEMNLFKIHSSPKFKENMFLKERESWTCLKKFMQTLHSYTMFTSSSKYFRTCSKIAIIIRGQWWIWSLDANSSGFLFQEILTAPLASQLQEPEELVSSLENVQIQYLILDSISQADKIFCCIFACVWFQRCCLLRTWYWSDNLKSLRDWGI